MDESELSSIVWRAPEWINALGGLRPDNVLDYFSQSPFFDRRSNNAALKMQSQFQNFGDVNEALRKMRGIEFVLISHNAPDLFVIYKQQRESYDEARTMGVYFIANGNVYLAPDVYNIIASRMLNINEAVKSAVDKLNDAVSFTSAGGYEYNRPITTSTEVESKESGKPDGEVTRTEIMAMHKALHATLNSM